MEERMFRWILLVFCVSALALAYCSVTGSAVGQEPSNGIASDPRNIKNGWVIPDEGYSDQPYIVTTNDGKWLCLMTTGKGVEGEGGQHVVATSSSDFGRNWSELIDIEPATGPEASWVMPLKVPSGRVYAFYTYNKNNIREVPNVASPSIRKRVDTLGAYVFKYSDDNGRTWSKERYEIPMPTFPFDRANNFDGKTLFFWGVGKPIIHRDAAYFGWAKVGKWGEPGVLVRSQGQVMRSDNILTERDPHKIRWQVLPEGELGLRAPKGRIAEETNLASMSDGKLHALYRTIDGYNCQAYSSDGGRHWTPPQYGTYAPGGRRMKQPRAADFVWKLSNGKYLQWYHNHGGEAAHSREWTTMATGYYRNRNPGWISGGIEKNGAIHWSQPEILLYDDDPAVRMSYPDFIESDERYFITETQKTVARVHEIDRTLLEGLWKQFEKGDVARPGLAVDLGAKDCRPGSSFQMPQLVRLDQRGGLSLDFWIRFDELSPNQIVFDARNEKGQGIALMTSDRFTLKIVLSDGQHTGEWDSDPGTHEGTLKINAWHHVVATVDGGPKLVTFVIDGALNDGGPVRQFGWGRFKPELSDVNGSSRAVLAKSLLGELKNFRIYNRHLRTSEAVGNFRADRAALTFD